MDSHLVALLPVAAVWGAAGLIADGLPRLDRVHTLRRRSGWLIVLSLSGLGLMASVALAGLGTAGPTRADRAAAGLALAVLPALVVAGSTVRRLHRLRAGAGAFATAPRVPVPPGLRAHAAHPLVGLPLQVTGLAMMPAVVAAGTPLGGPALTLGLLGIAVIGVRHALRHSRLATRALPGAGGPATSAGTEAVTGSATATATLHV
ncbi:hypothetical protein ACIBJE_19045 [Micromonospora sp. NPDC050187]|uniref:hypothetical protein n=1 Tax=Micromonospora sp. NPDC050187 TaxID=3364277 RepID=UPI003787D576